MVLVSVVPVSVAESVVLVSAALSAVPPSSPQASIEKITRAEKIVRSVMTEVYRIALWSAR